MTSNQHPLALELNQIIQNHPTVDQLLSQLGKRIFFPTRGLVAQSTEAKAKTDSKYNATIGIATDQHGPLGFKSIEKFYRLEHLKSSQIFGYTSSLGHPQLRKLWKERLYQINPSLNDRLFSLPMVTNGLSHAISIAADLFFDPGDQLLLADKIWDNYPLMFETIRDVRLQYFSFYQEEHFNLQGFKQILDQKSSDKKSIKVLLNIPNNPTGYSPTQAEVDQIVKMFLQLAESGNKILVILDEAYHGLFFEPGLIKESLFSQLVDLHPNLLAVKVCGATKEFYAWGFRVGFITFGIKGGDQSLYGALEKKCGGLIRGNISNISTSAQNILASVLEDQSYLEDSQNYHQILSERAKKVHEVLKQNQHYGKFFEPYPFNSGYFMLIKLKDLDAEDLRQKLLEKKIGTISIAQHDLRIAFSCLEKENIGYVFEKIYETCRELSQAKPST